MIVTYAPEGQETQKWDFYPDRVRASAAEMIERRWNGEPATYEGWRKAVLMGSMRARRILLWHLLKMRLHTLKFEDVDPCVGEIDVDFTRAELVKLRDEAAALKPRDDESRMERDRHVATLNRLIEEHGEEVDGEAVDPT